MSEEHENIVVMNENSVYSKPCINRESKSDELTIKLYSCHDINMKLLLVVTPPSIYHISRLQLDDTVLNRLSWDNLDNFIGESSIEWH